jgi:SAM-dependent MidA family methyltransferase
MNRLKDFIIKKIKEEGPITFETFMDMALYYPELGYYSSPRTAIGREGDFYTSPHLHPIFGAMLAKQLMEMWMIMGQPKPFIAVEMGAGVGYLCKDLLDYLHNHSEKTVVSNSKDDFLRALRYVIVEPYHHFEEKQRALLVNYSNCRGGLETHLCESKDKTEGANLRFSPELITWVKSLKVLNGKITGCIFSNELLDAFPVHLVEMEDELKEIYVDFYGGKFVEIKDSISSVKLSNYLKEFSVAPRPAYRTEINLRIKSWLEEAGTALLKGFLLTIDYGYSAREYYSEERTKGTLLCYHRHQLNENPFSYIGEQDITAHINFSSLKKWGTEFGLWTIGYCSQGTFLVSSGIDEMITELYADSSDYASDMAKIKGLIFPQGMGTSHDVMVQYKGEGSPELQGFSLKNQIGHL